MAEETYLRQIESAPRCWWILDRNGAELASTADVIFIHPAPLPVMYAARRLARALKLAAAPTWRRSEPSRLFFRPRAKRRVTPDEAAVKALRPARHRVYTPSPPPLLLRPVDHRPRRNGRSSRWRSTSSGRGTSSSVQGMRDALGRDIALTGRTGICPRARERRLAATTPKTPDSFLRLPDVHHRAPAPRPRSTMPGGHRDDDGPAQASGDGPVVPTYNPQRPAAAQARATAHHGRAPGRTTKQ